MPDTALSIQRLIASDALRAPLLRDVIQHVRLPHGSHGLDAGCGIGLQAVLLAEAVGPAGHVTGVDLSPAVLEAAAAVVDAHNLAARVTLEHGDVRALPFADASFDWIWSVDCVGYPAGELRPVLRELVRVVKPGGTIMLCAWSSQSLLPGYPLLEARLNATCSGLALFIRDQPPESHFARTRGWMQAAGLVDVAGHTFAGDIAAPLPDGVRHAVLSLFEMLRGERQPEVLPADWTAYQRLCQPAGAECILDVPDYYGFFTYTLFRGTRPHRSARP